MELKTRWPPKVTPIRELLGREIGDPLTSQDMLAGGELVGCGQERTNEPNSITVFVAVSKP
jgi:hypothetical protein